MSFFWTLITDLRSNLTRNIIRRGVKYIFWDEARLFSDSNKSQTVIFYHHLSRNKTSKEQMVDKVDEIRSKLRGGNRVIPILFKRGSHRVFFVIPTKHHCGLVSSRIREMSDGPCGDHFELPYTLES